MARGKGERSVERQQFARRARDDVKTESTGEVERRGDSRSEDVARVFQTVRGAPVSRESVERRKEARQKSFKERRRASACEAQEVRLRRGAR